MHSFISLLFIFLISVSSLFAQINYESTLFVAFEKAKSQDKIIHIKYYNSECETCIKVATLLDEQSLASFYNSNFINYKINTKDIKEEERDFLKRTGLNLKSVPFLLFFKVDEKLIHYASAPFKTEALLQIAVNALTPETRVSNLETLYKDGDRSVKTLYDYCRFAQVVSNESLVNQLADELFKVFPQRDLKMADSYLITRNCVNSIDNGFFKHWINNLDKLKGFESGAYADREVYFLQEIVAKAIHGKERENWDLSKIQLVKKYIQLLNMGDNPDVFFWQQEAGLWVKEGQEDKAIEVGNKMILSNQNNVATVVFIVSFFADIVEEKSSLSELIKWLEKVKNIEKSDYEKSEYSNVLKKLEGRLMSE